MIGIDYQLTRWVNDIEEVRFAINLLERGGRPFVTRKNKQGKRAVFVKFVPMNPAKFHSRKKEVINNAV